ncbi:RidA family protein [Aliikangiella coralliicola]|uniref:RidA family protein n=1 Tax=Aliikangiella coralliicola TaxID=2592383 RepID=A0A545U4L4_9GAMM|nr:Rid family detoxifying hydrolase [Aliikangiella coralliicola]TQV84411.1 RidA family protein [Aliikangiella coralliicola]
MKTIILTISIVVISAFSVLDFNSTVVAKEKSNKTVQFLNSERSGLSDLPFSEAVRVGNTLYLSGKIGTDPSTGKLVSGGIKAEARQTMRNIKSTLEAHGYQMSNLVKCTVMLADISEWKLFNSVYVTFFTKPYPARSAFGANGLALNARVEVECIAAVGD